MIGHSADVQREAWMNFDIHGDARTEGVALRRGRRRREWQGERRRGCRSQEG